MSTKKPKRRATTPRPNHSAPRRSSNSERPVSDKKVVGEIMGAFLTAITFGALERE